MSERAAIFLDRDGTIIEDTHYVRDPGDVRLIPSAAEALRRMQAKGYLLFIVSNQSGVGQGIIEDREFWAVHCRVCELLKEEKIEIAEFLYCFHHPDDGCHCRKPRAGLLPRQFQGETLSFRKSFAVGDKEIDVCLADTIGGEGCLVLTGKGRTELGRMTNKTRHRVCDDLLAFANVLPTAAGAI